ncbi:MAG TPA: hypothetical protein PK992_04485, partial [Planctomycetaceae bacterium]|nr:hypothetical protein [Planctomycetaceae bacterium]
PQFDDLVSRAERRLEFGTAVSEAIQISIQTQRDVGGQKPAGSESDSGEVLSIGGNSGGSPQFSRLFTRLWESRKRAAELADKSIECD